MASSKIALRLHGAFMIFAWIGSASLGMLVARYFKQTWTSTQCCKKDIWFVVHRTLMVLTWLLTMAGFLLIFYQSGWVWIYRPDESFDKNGNPHPILGCVTTVLCFVQPFMALLRPHPGASRYLLILHIFFPHQITTFIKVHVIFVFWAPDPLIDRFY